MDQRAKLFYGGAYRLDKKSVCPIFLQKYKIPNLNPYKNPFLKFEINQLMHKNIP